MQTKPAKALALVLFAFLALSCIPLPSLAQPTPDIFQAVLPEPAPKTPEVSTAELRQILASKSAVLFDARPHMEYAVSHIPGAMNVSAKPGASKALYISDVAEIGRAVKGDKAAPMVIYCNGPFCGKAKRLARELSETGYSEVKRYQLGTPVWRALGGVMQIETEGVRHIQAKDQTAVFIDARDSARFQAGSLAGARNVPAGELRAGKDQGMIKAAKNDGRLPMDDHNTRIVVFGEDGSQARAVAETLAKEAFHNVAFFDGPWDTLR